MCCVIYSFVQLILHVTGRVLYYTYSMESHKKSIWLEATYKSVLEFLFSMCVCVFISIQWVECWLLFFLFFFLPRNMTWYIWLFCMYLLLFIPASPHYIEKQNVFDFELSENTSVDTLDTTNASTVQQNLSLSSSGNFDQSGSY